MYKGEHSLKTQLRCLDNRSNAFNFTLSQIHILYCKLAIFILLDTEQTAKADNKRKFLLFLS